MEWWGSYLIVVGNNMCNLKSHVVTSIEGNRVKLGCGIEALTSKYIGPLKKNDKVIIFGNLIIKKL